MPPKRRSTRASRSSRIDDGTPQSYIAPDPIAGAPALPDIPTKHSFAYGSSAIPLLPRELRAKPKMGLAEIAEAIDEGIQMAQERDNDGPTTRSRVKSASPVRKSPSPVRKSPSPVRTTRRSRREPTPDQVQLFDNLNEATSPVRPQTSGDSPSTDTPTPPVPRALSTDSTPAPQPPKADQLYPSALMQVGESEMNDIMQRSSPHMADSVDNESTISWGVERDIHDDDLQRIALGNRYRDGPHGKNISAPPRRFSGLAFANETIAEEEEPEFEPPFEFDDGFQPEPEPEISSAPAQTIIPGHRESSVPQYYPTPQSQRPKRMSFFHVPDEVRARRTQAISMLGFVTMIALSIVAMCSYRDQVFEVSQDLGRCLSFGRRYPPMAFNGTNMDAFNSIYDQMGYLGSQVSSLSKEVKFIKTDMANRPAATLPVAHSGSTSHLIERPKTNFLSINMGVLVDPRNTSPTVDQPQTFMVRLYHGIFGRRFKASQPPLAALAPWDEVGDCWCGTTTSDGMTQLSILLGHKIVPQDVVVEHMPKGASITPEVAPKEMELWARFVVVKDAAKNTPPSSSSSSSKSSPMVTDNFSLHDTVMSALKTAYSGQPKSAYSDDPLLGSSFYRIGLWQYDLHETNFVQQYNLDAVIDIPSIRVDKVVFRVKSNWGGNATCLYRLRMHGHL